MQKKIIALAVAGLMSGAAFAQSNVEIYGVAGIYGQMRDVGGVKVNELRTDGESGSRLGFRGTEDLGGGMKAMFVVETAINADSAGNAQASGITGLGNRQVWAGLSTGFGTVSAGRQYSPMFGLQSGTVDLWGYADWSTVVATQARFVRVNNSVQFATTNMGGVVAKIMYAFGEGTKTATVDSQNAGQHLGLSVEYANGPIKAGLAYHQQKNGTAGQLATTNTLNQALNTLGAAPCAALLGNANCGNAAATTVSGVASTGSQKDTMIGGSYNLGMATVAGGMQWEKTAAGVKTKSYTLGGDVKVGAGSVIASYSNKNVDNTATGDMKAYAIGYRHALSKRTNLVAGFSKFTTDVQGAASTSDKRTFAGVRHTF